MRVLTVDPHAVRVRVCFYSGGKPSVTCSVRSTTGSGVTAEAVEMTRRAALIRPRLSAASGLPYGDTQETNSEPYLRHRQRTQRTPGGTFETQSQPSAIELGGGGEGGGCGERTVSTRGKHKLCMCVYFITAVA